jgi:hypothetical protein
MLQLTKRIKKWVKKRNYESKIKSVPGFGWRRTAGRDIKAATSRE